MEGEVVQRKGSVDKYYIIMQSVWDWKILTLAEFNMGNPDIQNYYISKTAKMAELSEIKKQKQNKPTLAVLHKSQFPSHKKDIYCL